MEKKQNNELDQTEMWIPDLSLTSTILCCHLMKYPATDNLKDKLNQIIPILF